MTEILEERLQVFEIDQQPARLFALGRVHGKRLEKIPDMVQASATVGSLGLGKFELLEITTELILLGDQQFGDGATVLRQKRAVQQAEVMIYVGACDELIHATTPDWELHVTTTGLPRAKQRLSRRDGALIALEAPAKQYGVVGKARHAVVASCEIAQAPQSRIILAEQPLVVASLYAVDSACTKIEQLLLKVR